MAAKPAATKRSNPKKTSKSSLYAITGHDIKRSKRACPKCGPGVFLAQHENRESCGNCGFLEWKKKE
ncbi:MAG: 30S ribosomal protein S27ae [archaeon]